jgi:hypothetical protein
MRSSAVATDPRPAAGRAPAALASACTAMSVAVMMFLVVTRLFYKQLHMGRDFEFDRVALAALAAALGALGLLAPRLGARLTLTGFSTLSAVALALAGCLALSIDVAGRVKQVITSVVFREHHADIYDGDDRYGYVLRPNARDRERSSEFDIVYSVDASGRRVTPSPKTPRATVVMAGDSFTFGTGVEDHETYPYLLGAEHWPDVKVVNAGVGGWGPTQGYLTVVDTLGRAPLPAAIVYGIIPDDQFRSYLRAPITMGMTRRLEFVDGTFAMKNVSERASAPAITPELVERELQMNRTLLINMYRECRRKQVGFAIVLMQDAGNYPPDLIYALAAEQIPIVDLTRLQYERFPHDYHPNPADQRRIAAAIASSVVARMIGAAPGRQ